MPATRTSTSGEFTSRGARAADDLALLSGLLCEAYAIVDARDAKFKKATGLAGALDEKKLNEMLSKVKGPASWGEDRLDE